MRRRLGALVVAVAATAAVPAAAGEPCELLSAPPGFAALSQQQLWSNCTACTSGGCAYDVGTLRCLPLDALLDPATTAFDAINDASLCPAPPACSQYDDCATCVASSLGDCAWCASSGACLPSVEAFQMVRAPP